MLLLLVGLSPALGLSDRLLSDQLERPGPSVSIPLQGDEFAGPFPSWRNVRTDYGAAGDGATDDAPAIQRALTDLGTSAGSPVLFLPRGRYRITRTLVLAFTMNVSVVGEDPATTAIIWDGPDEGTMLSVNGVAYSRFIRLTFDGRGKASVAVEQSWDGSRPHFDTGNEYADDRFVDVEYGIRGGFAGHGFAETSVVRSHFVRNTGAGLVLGNFNALDLWVWYSVFDRCNVGITNATGAGNFHVYNSIFRSSGTADLSMQHTGGFSARGNYSLGSRAFFISARDTNNPATIHLQGNRVIDPIDSAAVRLTNQGPGLLTDNIFVSRDGSVGPVVQWASLLGADVAAIGNTFTTVDPLAATGRLLDIDNRVVSRATLTPTEPVPPPTLPNLSRRVVEVPQGTDGRMIQRAIDEAAVGRGTRPIVHIPHGTYLVSRPLVVPPGDVQLVGDGYGTILRWAGKGEGPVISVHGPSQAALRELQIDGAGAADGLIVYEVDQVGSRVYMQQVQLRSARQADLLVDGTDHVTVQLEDFGHAYSPLAPAIRVTGGPLSAVGKSSGGRTNVFSGASSGNALTYVVSRGARLLVRDLWYESGAGPGFVRVDDHAVFTADGVRVASPVKQDLPAIDIVGPAGRVAIVSAHLDDRIRITGTGGTRVLVLGLFCEQPWSDCFVNAGSPPARALVRSSRQIGSGFLGRSIEAPDSGPADPALITELLGHARGEVPAVVTSLPAGVTDFRMFRVWVGNGIVNVRLAPGAR